jgi:hypothetical protein
MSTNTPIPTQDVNHSLKQWLIRLGWLGLALWVLELASEALKLELTDSVNLRFAFHLLRALLGWLAPVALALQFRASSLWAPLRYTLMGIAAALIIPACLISLLTLLFGWVGHEVNWENEQVLYESATDPDIRVVAQSRYDGFPTSDPQHRIVKLTPVLDLWQLAEPVDTATFNWQGWQRRY